MIIQISDDDSIILRCHTFDNAPKMHDFFIAIKNNHLYVSRNSGEDMKTCLSESKPPLFMKRMKKEFLKTIKSKPQKTKIILIKLEKEKKEDK